MSGWHATPEPLTLDFHQDGGDNRLDEEFCFAGRPDTPHEGADSDVECTSQPGRGVVPAA